MEIKEMMATVHERWMFLGVSDCARPLLVTTAEYGGFLYEMYIAILVLIASE